MIAGRNGAALEPEALPGREGLDFKYLWGFSEHRSLKWIKGNDLELIFNTLHWSRLCIPAPMCWPLTWYVEAHLLFFIAPCRYGTFYKLKVCDNPASSKSVGTIFPIAFAHFVSLGHILKIISVCRASSLLLYRGNQWSLMLLLQKDDDSLKAQTMVSVFSNESFSLPHPIPSFIEILLTYSTV